MCVLGWKNGLGLIQDRSNIIMSKYANYHDIFKEWIDQGFSHKQIGLHFSEELGVSLNAIRNHLNRLAKIDPSFKSRYALTRVKVVTHPNGSETTVDALRNQNRVSTEGMRIKSVTDLGYGVQNVKYDNDDSLNKEDLIKGFESVLEKYNPTPILYSKPKLNFDGALRVIISDEHIGMNPQPEKSIFKYHYGRDEYLNSMTKVTNSMMEKYYINGTFDRIFIDNLGDGLDGQNARTTRGGHALPQNMTNAEMFELFFDSKLKLVRFAIDNKMATKVVMRFIVNDNHSGDFALYCAIAIKKMIEQIYDADLVEIDILERFMEARRYGDHAHILTHGKDKEYMKRGLPLELNPTAIKFINDFIDHHNIDSKYIHVDKGDLHQLGYSRTNKFEYTNFGSFAPPSAWIQHNFGDSYSCFSTQVIPKASNEISQTNCWLDYKRI